MRGLLPQRPAQAKAETCAEAGAEAAPRLATDLSLAGPKPLLTASITYRCDDWRYRRRPSELRPDASRVDSTHAVDRFA